MTTERANVEIEQIENGYIVTLSSKEDEVFFDDFEAVVSYLKFCFNIEEEDEEMNEPCVEHHWETPSGDNRCIYCQMKYSYWLDVKRAIDRGDTEREKWQGKSHHHKEV